ncbi:hypothetical protein [Burkholderia cenocepacia]|uniref:Depolymerase 2 capsule K5-specific C-terminal domain-containing protein n=1 Tax=Burkholderia cenocepacia TaxID=95486 RepID=A0A3Q9FB87_9BURK|nr:hypothetical protein [Burkholderia cenocepacia]AZQ54078.1 hypothetical protein D5R55_24280 [Burkholderia cenocepacia]
MVDTYFSYGDGGSDQTLWSFHALFVGGIDGRSVKIVATNGNCTIANNANIQTNTGGRVVMASGHVLTFTFDATLNKWCGG